MRRAIVSVAVLWLAAGAGGARGATTRGDAAPAVDPGLPPVLVAAAAGVDREALTRAFSCLGLDDATAGCRAVVYWSGPWFAGAGRGLRPAAALAARLHAHPAHGALLLTVMQVAEARRYQYTVGLHTVIPDADGRPQISTRYGVSYLGTAADAAAAPAAVSAVLAAMLAPQPEPALSGDRDRIQSAPRLQDVLAAGRPGCRNAYRDWRFVRAVGDLVWVRAELDPKFGPLVFVTRRCQSD